jgi:peroxiredoxin
LVEGVRVTSLAVLRLSLNQICVSNGQGESDKAMENAKLPGSTGSSVKSGNTGLTVVSELLPAGREAPDFSLHVTPDQTLSLRELRGKPVILAFYPADWSPVCGDQMALYNEVLPEFQKFGAELLGVSVDGVWSHRAFAEARHLHFPLLADFEPKGAVAQSYGAYRNSDGFSERALFVIDKSGIIAWSYRSPIAVNPGADGILQALEDLPK